MGIFNRAILEENCWDHKQQRVNARHPDATNINRVLDVIRGDIQRHFSLIIARQHVTADAVKNAYLGIKEKEYTLCEAFEMHNGRFTEKVKARK